MPIALPNTTVADAYPPATGGGAQIFGNDVFATGWFTVANNAVICEYAYGVQGQGQFSPEMFLAPGTYPIYGTEPLPLKGIRFRNAVAGANGQVWGSFFYKNDPVLTSSAQFTGTVSAGGTVNPPAVSLKSAKASAAAVNNAAFTAVTFNAITWDDYPFLSLVNNFQTVPSAGKFLTIIKGIVAGQSGNGNGAVRVDRLTSGGVFIETICRQDGYTINIEVSCSGIGNYNLGDRIQFLSTNGATGTAGTVQVFGTVMGLQ